MDGKQVDNPTVDPSQSEKNPTEPKQRSTPTVTRRGFLAGGAAAIGALFGLGKTREASAGPIPTHAGSQEDTQIKDFAGAQERTHMEPGAQMAQGQEDVQIKDFAGQAERVHDTGSEMAQSQTDVLSTDPAAKLERVYDANNSNPESGPMPVPESPAETVTPMMKPNDDNPVNS
jgi:hypothetical protein